MVIKLTKSYGVLHRQYTEMETFGGN